MSLYQSFRRCLDTESPVALATVIEGPREVGTKLLVWPDGTFEGELKSAQLSAAVAGDAVRLLLEERSNTQTYELAGEVWQVFIDVFPAAPRMVIVGASHAAGPLSTFARQLGFRVTVTDARAAFAVPDRFPDAEQVLKGWPQDVLPGLVFDPSTYVILLSHDPKFDEPTLRHVLPTSARYIGAIGSRRTQEERFARLRAEGFDEDQLARIYGPVGLDIGARSPEETALAILAEVTAVRYGRPGGHMRNRLGGTST